MSGRRPHEQEEVDLTALGQSLVQRWLEGREQEQELIRRESAAQTALAKRRWAETFGVSAGPSPGTDAGRVLQPEPVQPRLKRSAGNSPKQRTSRPKLAKKIQDDWKTAEGMRVLVSLPMRDLARNYGVRSHASFYDVPFFVERIVPLRQAGRRGQQSGNWVEWNARDRGN